MGIYNYWGGKLPPPLNENKCCVCDGIMQPFNENPDLDGFQYKCVTCNSKIIIEISGSLLASSLFEDFIKNGSVRKIIQNKIHSCPDKRFPITTYLIRKLID